MTRSPNTNHVPPPAPWTLMATPEIDSGSDEGTRAQRGDASWTRSHGWWTEATGSKPRTSATTAVPLCVPVPPGLPPAGFHARMHPRGGGGGRPGTDPLCPVRRKGCGSCEACPPSFRLSRASLLGGSSLTSWARGSPPNDRALYQRPSFQITDRDWPAPPVQGTPQRRAQSQVFGAGLRQSSPCSEALAPRGPLRGCPR